MHLLPYWMSYTTALFCIHVNTRPNSSSWCVVSKSKSALARVYCNTKYIIWIWGQQHLVIAQWVSCMCSHLPWSHTAGALLIDSVPHSKLVLTYQTGPFGQYSTYATCILSWDTGCILSLSLLFLFVYFYVLPSLLISIAFYTCHIFCQYRSVSRYKWGYTLRICTHMMNLRIRMYMMDTWTTYRYMQAHIHI